MAIAVTKANFNKFQQRYDNIKNRMARIRESAEETTTKLVAIAETGGTAFAMGVVQGKTGGVSLFGVPLELGVAGVGIIGGLMGGAGKASDHLVNVGAGALAAYATTMGRGVGASWAQKAAEGQSSLPPQAAVSGLGAGGLNPFEVAQAAAMAGVPR